MTEKRSCRAVNPTLGSPDPLRASLCNAGVRAAQSPYGCCRRIG